MGGRHGADIYEDTGRPRRCCLGGTTPACRCAGGRWQACRVPPRRVDEAGKRGAGWERKGQCRKIKPERPGGCSRSNWRGRRGNGTLLCCDWYLTREQGVSGPGTAYHWLLGGGRRYHFGTAIVSVRSRSKSALIEHPAVANRRWGSPGTRSRRDREGNFDPCAGSTWHRTSLCLSIQAHGSGARRARTSPEVG